MNSERYGAGVRRRRSTGLKRLTWKVQAILHGGTLGLLLLHCATCVPIVVSAYVCISLYLRRRLPAPTKYFLNSK